MKRGYISSSMTRITAHFCLLFLMNFGIIFSYSKSFNGFHFVCMKIIFKFKYLTVYCIEYQVLKNRCGGQDSDTSDLLSATKRKGWGNRTGNGKKSNEDAILIKNPITTWSSMELILWHLFLWRQGCCDSRICVSNTMEQIVKSDAFYPVLRFTNNFQDIDHQELLTN